MKALAITGGQAKERRELSQSISTELIRRRYRVAQWLESALPPRLDAETTTVASASGRAQITWEKTFRLEDFLPYLQEDFLLLDHGHEALPCLSLPQDNMHTGDDYVIAYIGRVRHAVNKPVFQTARHLSALVDFIVAETPDILPFPDGNPCCKACGRQDCREMLRDIIAHTATVNDCLLRSGRPRAEIVINGFNLPLVQFVQDIICESCLGLLSVLNGYKPNSTIEIRLNS
jgi:molybdopterin-guanine dinucleotide biosynthesis protein B